MERRGEIRPVSTSAQPLKALAQILVNRLWTVVHIEEIKGDKSRKFLVELQPQREYEVS
jgi:hypothetical protein